MGDRRQVIFNFEQDTESRIYLYTHWNGSTLPSLVAEALHDTRSRNRWADPRYLVRLIVERLAELSGDHQSETGWGLSPTHLDSEYQYDVQINLHSQSVTIECTLPYQQFIDCYFPNNHKEPPL